MTETFLVKYILCHLIFVCILFIASVASDVIFNTILTSGVYSLSDDLGNMFKDA